MILFLNDNTKNIKVSENFRVKEFACKDGSNVVIINEELVRILQDIRNHFAKPVIINSAYRTPSWNKHVGGTTESYHMVGMAADIVIRGISSTEIAKYASEIMDRGGVIKYTNFVHVDVRTTEKYRKGVT